jgi:hypothetical protein
MFERVLDHCALGGRHLRHPGRQPVFGCLGI